MLNQLKTSLLVLLVLCSLASCADQQNKEVKEASAYEGVPETWIDVPDSLSNYEAFLNSGTLVYAAHMSPDYQADRYDWDYVDTVEVDNEVFARVRGYDCDTTEEMESRIQSAGCTEMQEHRINLANNKVYHFDGTGADYAATIDFLYDAEGRLISCFAHPKERFTLRYSPDGELVEVVQGQEVYGIATTTKVIRFRPLAENH